MSTPKKFYRFEAVQYTSVGMDGEYERPRFPHATIECREYSLYGETPKGYWIGHGKPGQFVCTKHWVSKTARKRFAYPTKKEAMQSFIAKKKRQISILKTNLEFAESALYKAENLTL